jgi:alpha-beta hydrolase superfamily lysophospholipase
MHRKELMQIEDRVEQSEFYIDSHDNLSLYARIYKSASRPKAIIIIIHGYSEHSGRYNHWAERFVKHGYYVLSYDLRGHGLSELRKGYRLSYYKFIKDLSIVCQKAESIFPEIPKIIYGHCFGGNLVINYLISDISNIDGLIVSAPWLQTEFHIPRLKLLFGYLFRNIVPRFLIRMSIRPEDLSRDPVYIENVMKDPLVCGHIPARLLSEIKAAGARASKSIYKINLPMLVMHGTADRITSFKASKEFVMNSSKRTTFREWTGHYHDLHNDTDADEVFGYVTEWLDKTFKQQVSEINPPS